MSGLALFRRSPSESLVKAPSLDLIKSDDELTVPKPQKIKCLMSKEELADYEKLIADNEFNQNNRSLQIEKLRHCLNSLDFGFYPAIMVDNIMSNWIKLIRDNKTKKITRLSDMWWDWIPVENYPHLIPPSIIKILKSLKDKGIFFISDIREATGRYNYQYTGISVGEMKRIPEKHLTEICFLRIAVDNEEIQKESYVIAAWIGPTGRDQEANIETGTLETKTEPTG